MRAPITAALSVALLVAATAADAQDQKVDGVRAAVNHGTLEVKGGDQSNTVVLRLKSGDASRVQVDVGNNGSADFEFARADIEAIRIRMGDGNDVVDVDDANGPVNANIPTTIAGGDGNDALAGGRGAETFRGGDGDDTIRWDPGDGSDVIEGQDGTDTMLFNGAAGSEVVNVSANGGRLTFARQPGNITMDTGGVEVVRFNALGGQDAITVGDLTGTDVRRTNLDLAPAIGGATSDLLADRITVLGTDGDDDIAVTGNGSGADVTGLASTVSVTHADPAGTDHSDSLAVDTRGGDDHVSVNGVAGLIDLSVS